MAQIVQIIRSFPACDQIVIVDANRLIGQFHRLAHDHIEQSLFAEIVNDRIILPGIEDNEAVRVLAAMQGAKVIKIALDEEKNFDLPADFLAQAEGANLLIFPRPNAPTGNAFAKEDVRRLCREFNGIVVIDEAYGDFSADNCMEFASLFPNVLVMRTMSKSYGLAGLRLGYAVGAKELIDGLMKLKDSYNVDMISQVIAEAAFLDREYFNARCEEIKAQRALLGSQLEKLNFRIIPSEANFLFVSPPDGDGERCFKLLRESAVVVRYFPKAAGGKYVRITIGTPDECARLMEILNGVYAK